MSRDRWIQNPYRPGKVPAKLEQCIPIRQEELREICAGIRNNRCISLIGESGSGKSSVLTFLRLNEDLRSRHGLTQNFVFCYNDFTGTKTESDFYKELIRFLEDEDLFPPNVIEGERLWQVMQWLFRDKRGQTLALLLDNFHGICHGDFSPGFFDNMKAIAENANVCFVTATQKKLHEVAPEKLDVPFFGNFQPVYLGSITEEEFELFVKGPSREFGNALERHKDSIQNLAGGLPGYVELACHHYFNAWMDDKLISQKEETEIYYKFMNDCESRFNHIWEQRLDDEERKVVRFLARLSFEEQKGQLESMHPSRIASLKRKGYIFDNRLFSVAFADYIKQQIIKEPPDISSFPVPEVGTDRPGVSFDENGDVQVVWVVDNKVEKRLIAREDFAPLERYLLELLIENRGKVCDYREITDKAWGRSDPTYIGAPIPKESIQQTVRRLREKIEPDPSNPCFILIVRSEGYKLVDPGNPSALLGILGFLAPLLIFGKGVSKGVLIFGKGLLELARWTDEILAVIVVLAIVVLVVLVLLGKVDPEALLGFVKRLF